MTSTIGAGGSAEVTLVIEGAGRFDADRIEAAFTANGATDVTVKQQAGRIEATGEYTPNAATGLSTGVAGVTVDAATVSVDVRRPDGLLAAIADAAAGYDDAAAVTAAAYAATQVRVTIDGGRDATFRPADGETNLTVRGATLSGPVTAWETGTFTAQVTPQAGRRNLLVAVAAVAAVTLGAGWWWDRGRTRKNPVSHTEV